MSQKTTGLKEIAYELKISVNTVSRALRDCDDIAESTKALVRETAIKMGYLPNTISQFIKRSGKPLIVIVACNFDNYFFVLAIKKLMYSLNTKKYDYSVIIGDTDCIDEDIIKQCISQRADAIISLIDINEKSYEIAKYANIPIILFGRKSVLDCDEVYEDNSYGVYLAAQFLASKTNTNKYIFLGQDSSPTSSLRFEQFKKSVDTIVGQYEIRYFDRKEGYQKILESKVEGFDALIGYSDETIYYTLYNQKVPQNARKQLEEMTIIGFDCLSTRIPGLIDINSIDYDYDLMCQNTLSIVAKRLKKLNDPKTSCKCDVFLHIKKRHS